MESEIEVQAIPAFGIYDRDVYDQVAGGEDNMFRASADDRREWQIAAAVLIGDRGWSFVLGFRDRSVESDEEQDEWDKAKSVPKGHEASGWFSTDRSRVTGEGVEGSFAAGTGGGGRVLSKRRRVVNRIL
jgi:hypothetical protein